MVKLHVYDAYVSHHYWQSPHGTPGVQHIFSRSKGPNVQLQMRAHRAWTEPVEMTSEGCPTGESPLGLVLFEF